MNMQKRDKRGRFVKAAKVKKLKKELLKKKPVRKAKVTKVLQPEKTLPVVVDRPDSVPAPLYEQEQYPQRKGFFRTIIDIFLGR